MEEFMRKTREIYYKEREKLSFSFSSNTWLRKPKWMLLSKDKRFEATYKDQRILIRKGRIVIAKIVQANTLLFKQGQHDSPAAMIFSEDSYFEKEPDKLENIASELHRLKGLRYDDDELQRFSEILADEMVTLFNVEIPEKITYGKKVFFTTFMVHREHLPNGYINFGCFPALIYPEKTEASIILPSKYWATESIEVVTSIKDLNDKIELINNDPERYIKIAQKFIEYASAKSRISWLGKAKWSSRVSICRYQISTALINCGRIEEAKELLEELLAGLNIGKVQEEGNTFYMLILSNLISTLINLERFGEAKENILLLERTISNCKDKAKIESFHRLVEWKRMELDILDGDIERGVSCLKSLSALHDNKTYMGNVLLYLGIYHYKRNEKDKALDCFKKASDVIKAPYSLKRIQYYIRMLSYKEPVYSESTSEEC